MKKILAGLLTVFIVVMMLFTVAFADTSSAEVSLTAFLTWEFLGTMAGAVFATTLIIQFCKFPLDKVWKIPTRFVVYILALLILFAVEFVTGKVTIDKSILIIFNAIIVATSAMGTYDITFKKLE